MTSTSLFISDPFRLSKKLKELGLICSFDLSKISMSDGGFSKIVTAVLSINMLLEQA